MSKLNTFHVVTGIVCYFKICLTFPKLKHTIHYNLERNFQLNGYHLIRPDHPRNTKQGGVYIYRDESLSVRLVKLSNLSQCITCNVFLQDCKGYIGVVCRSPSQCNTKFENILSDFDNLLSKSASSNTFFTIIFGNFNATSSSWRKEAKTTAQGTQFEGLTFVHNFRPHTHTVPF